jgi:hypothetical protein
MDILSGDISVLVFRRVGKENLGEFSLDRRMLTVLMELDGKQNLSDVAKKTGLTLGATRDAISKLFQLKLIEPADVSISMLDEDFVDYLQAQLSLAIGPLAEVLIEDAVSDMGCQRSQIPSHRAAELIDLLAREIQREDKMLVFKQDMLKKIRENGY